MIRPAKPEDAEDIAAIWNRVIRDTTITFTTIEKSVQDVHRLINAYPVFVAVTGHVAGFCTYGPFRNGPGYRFVAEHSIHTRTETRRSGIGTALMDALEQRAIADNIDCMIGAMTGDNDASIEFHLSRGFKQVGHLPALGEKFGARHDLVLMQKHLDLSH